MICEKIRHHQKTFSSKASFFSQLQILFVLLVAISLVIFAQFMF